MTAPPTWSRKTSLPLAPSTEVSLGGSFSIALLSTHPPTQCGLATFNAALYEHLALAPGTVEVVRVVDTHEAAPGSEVVAHLVNGSPASALKAVRRLNCYDAVVVQHEYGIYGGPDGSDVVDLVEALTVPTIIVFHTVLQDPTSRQRHILERLLTAAEVAVTMTETARSRLAAVYGADPSTVVMIPHGAVDVRRGDPSPADPSPADPSPADPSPVGRRPLVLTWGLLGPGKGIEWAIDAMPGLRDLAPRYVVLGRTHPKVLERQGEAYRAGLQARIDALGAGDLVELDDSYLGVRELADLVATADVVLLPYDSREQVTSGVLTEAVAAGRPVVSTAFPHAVELLTDGPGLVVPQGDPVALQAALRRVLSEPGLAQELAARAAEKAPELLWGAVAARYRQVAGQLVATRLSAAS